MCLKIDNLSIWQDQRLLIHSFDEQVSEGEIIALVGNNGFGKSTLLKTLAGLLAIDSGTVKVGPVALDTLAPLERAQIISFLPQSSLSHPYCSAESRIAHGLIPIFGCDFFINVEHQAMIHHVAMRLKIEHLLKKPLAKMSGGEERLVHLAKCLINPQVKLLLLDEPSVFLDFSQQDNLARCLKEEASTGKTIIFSSHDQHFIDRLAERVLRIENRELSSHTYRSL